jgi:hypothetical protein
MHRVKGASRRGNVSGSFRRDFYEHQNSLTVAKRCDLKISVADMDDLMEIDPRQARMLERGTGRLRKCKVCGEVYVNDGKDERMFGVWLNRNGFVCFLCRKGIKLDYKKDTKFKRKRDIMQKVWDLYIQRLNQGVKTAN